MAIEDWRFLNADCMPLFEIINLKSSIINS